MPEQQDRVTATLAEQRTLLGSAGFALEAVAVSTTTGALLGSVAGFLYMQNPVSWGFGMGSNWAVASVPFFVCREGVMHLRHYLNARGGIPNLLVRDKDEMIASTCAGAVVGGLLGNFWRGARAIPAGIIVYGLGAAVGQSLYTTGRHWRQSVAARMAIEEQVPQNQSVSQKPQNIGQVWKDLGRDFRTSPHVPSPADDMDPIGWLIKKISANMKEHYDVPDWASPILNAIDMDYRIRLNTKIDILEHQIAELKQKVEERDEMQKL